MKIKKVAVLFILLLTFACKNENKKTEKVENSKEEIEKPKENSFEKSLVDYRKVNQQFRSEYKVNGFGVQKNSNDQIQFVFKLTDSTTKETVENYSFGIRIFDANLPKPINFSFNPIVTNHDNNKYIIASSKNIPKLKYIDSLESYIYKKNDWKGSGALGVIKIKDILIEK